MAGGNDDDDDDAAAAGGDGDDVCGDDGNDTAHVDHITRLGCYHQRRQLHRQYLCLTSEALIEIKFRTKLV